MRRPSAKPTAASDSVSTQRRAHVVNRSHKSLFRNILTVSYLDSRFYAGSRAPLPRNRHKMNILANRSRKGLQIQSPCKSLLSKILPAKSLDSIFCEPPIRSVSHNSNKMNILKDQPRAKLQPALGAPLLPASGTCPPLDDLRSWKRAEMHEL